MKIVTKTAILSLFLAFATGISRSSWGEAPLVSPSPEEQLASQSAEADRLFLAGRAALGQRHWAESRILLLRAFSLKRSFDTAANLAVAASALHLHTEAARYAWYSLSQFPATADARKRAELVSYYDDARKRVARVEIRSQAGALITLDGTPLSSLAEANAPAFIVPGKVRVEVTLAGHRGEVRDVLLEAGKSIYLDLRLIPELPDVSAMPPTRVFVQSTPSGNPQRSADARVPQEPQRALLARPSLVPLGISGGLTVVSAAVAVVFRVIGDSASRNAEDLKFGMSDSACSAPGNSARCAEIQQDYQRAKNARDASTAAFLVAGAGLVGTGISGYVYWRAYQRLPRASSSGQVPRVVRPLGRSGSLAWVAVPTLEPGQLGLALWGRF